MNEQSILARCLFLAAWVLAFVACWCAFSYAKHRIVRIAGTFTSILGIGVLLYFASLAAPGLKRYGELAIVRIMEPKLVAAPTAPRAAPSAPKATDDVRIQFTSSSLWTNARKATVREQIQSFDKYLSGLRIDPPAILPLISITENRVVTYGFVGPANPPYDQRQIPVSTKSLDAFSIRRMYAVYVFDTILGVQDAIGKAALTPTSWLYSEYFAASSLDSPPSLDEKRYEGWIAALWDIRKLKGKDFTDRALVYSIKAPVAYDDDLTRYFRARLQQGLLVVKNDWNDVVEVDQILKNHRLLQ